LRWAIRNADLNPDRDFTIVATGSGTTIRAALESGRLAAAVGGTTDTVDYQLTAPVASGSSPTGANRRHSGQW